MPSLANHQSNDFTKVTIDDVAAYFNRPLMINEHGCWIWLGATDNRGYGRIGQTLIYGAVWRMTGRELPIGHELRHMCPHHSCVNPDHLCTGTHAENVQDAVALGAMGRPRTLSDEQMKIIQERLKEGVPKFQICKEVGISQQWMNKFLKGGFKHAKPE